MLQGTIVANHKGFGYYILTIEAENGKFYNQYSEQNTQHKRGDKVTIEPRDLKPWCNIVKECNI